MKTVIHGRNNLCLPSTKRNIQQEHVYLKKLVPLQVLHFDMLPSTDTLALGSWRAHTSDVHLLFEEEEAVVSENLRLHFNYLSHLN